MVDGHLVQIKDISEIEFEEINNLLMKDPCVSKYVQFSFHSLITQGIFYKSVLIGLLNLHAFISESLSISIALLSEYRHLGISKKAIQKVIEKYGQELENIAMFIANVSPQNKNAILAFQNMDLKQTHAFDEVMIEEGAEFFLLFYAENPYRKLVKK